MTLEQVSHNMNNNKCTCEKCIYEGSSVFRTHMIVCSVCGNKRCPHATDHNNPCTNSNEPGQKGSSYEHVRFPSNSKENSHEQS